MRVGGTVKNTLKGGETEKRGGDAKILKSEGASWVKASRKNSVLLLKFSLMGRHILTCED